MKSTSIVGQISCLSEHHTLWSYDKVFVKTRKKNPFLSFNGYCHFLKLIPLDYHYQHVKNTRI